MKKGLSCVLLLAAVMSVVVVMSRCGGSSSDPDPVPDPLIEDRAACTNYSATKQPLFGDLHVHTGYSSDSYAFGTRTTPQDAYDFARGGEISLPSTQFSVFPPQPDPLPTRTAQIDRPLDFAAVADHAEFFGALNACTTVGSAVYDEPDCVAIRSEGFNPAIPEQVQQLGANGTWNARSIIPETPTDVCADLGIDCTDYEISLWDEIQDAAEQAYDRTDACEMTTFVAYEFTASPNNANLHRNVIFRNENVPQQPATYLDANTDMPFSLFQSLRSECLDSGAGCDVLTIPHNPNLSTGLMFEDPATPAEAADRAFFEPLVEVYQHKASSECYYNPLFGTGVGTSDEECGFEKTILSNLDLTAPIPPMTDPATLLTERSFVRNVLKDGMKLEQELGVNPFKLGMVGGTDTHNSTPGATEERAFPGHAAELDAGSVGVPLGRVSNPLATSFSPGGLTVAWAEENTRNSIFEALRRKEVYATSGTRPTVRFFGGWDYTDTLLTGTNAEMLEAAYSGGVPMGGDLDSNITAGSTPKFLISVAKDPEGSDLQYVQVVKGWVDADGNTQELVFDVAGNKDNGASVDMTCATTGSGAATLEIVWEDTSFDPTLPAFYYVRVFENPTCRYSTRECQAFGVNPLEYIDPVTGFDAASCSAAQAASPLAFFPPGFPPGVNPDYPAGNPIGGGCCVPIFEPVIKERAWTSPIWYTP